MSERRAHRYRVVDVFTETPLEGNPVAVFPASAELDPTTMQAIARELNLAETVFVCPPTRAGCAMRLRIFTPAHEMAFAGHPTIGASWVLQAEGIVARDSEHFLLDEIIGAIPIRVERGAPPLIWLSTPPVRKGQRYEPALCAKLLGLDAGDLLAAAAMAERGQPDRRDAAKRTRCGRSRWARSRRPASAARSDGEPVCAYVFAPTRAAPMAACSRRATACRKIPRPAARWVRSRHS